VSKDQRFFMGSKEGMLVGAKVITDTETGVQYLFAYEGNAGGPTLLVDQNGKPLLDKRYVNHTEQKDKAL
jgi:hypothetical protein